MVQWAKNRRAKGKDEMAMEYMLKTQAVAEVIQRTGAGRFIVEKRMSEMESSGQIRFVDDPRDSRKKLIGRDDVEKVVRTLTPS